MSDSDDDRIISTEFFTACLIVRGFAVADFDKFTFGMLINFCREWDRVHAKASGKKVKDEEKQLEKLKKIQPLIKRRYEAGLISKERYEGYVKLLNKNYAS